jgi:hypothetical protein
MEDIKPRLIVLGVAVLLAFAWALTASGVNARVTERNSFHPNTQSERTLPGWTKGK